MPATLYLKFGDEPTIQHEVVMDFNTMKIDNAPSQEKFIKEFYAVEAVDTAELTYFILQPDVSVVEHDQQLKIQAKLKSNADEDVIGNGQGVTRSSLILYNVSSEESKKNKNKKIKAVKEPKDKTIVEFYLN